MPKPPRDTLLEAGSDDEEADDERPEASPLLKKLWPDDEACPLHHSRDVQLVPLGCAAAGAAIPGGGGVGAQLWRGISVEAAVPTATVPIRSSATCEERLGGGSAGGGGGSGLRLPNSLVGSSAMVR